MDVKHRIGVNTLNDVFITTIEEMGIYHEVIKLPGKGGNVVVIVVNESDQHWSEILELVKKEKHFELYGEGDQYETTFSETEIRNAEWLILKSTFEHGYPQPQATWPLKQSSLENVCPKCGVYEQTGKMRIKKEPKLGNNSFMSLIWAGEIFCVPNIIAELQRINARVFEDWDVLINQTNQPSQTIRQLFIPKIAQPGLVVENNQEKVVCQRCGTTKYYPHVLGRMRLRRGTIEKGIDFILTNEWFGAGLIAYRDILISNRVAQLILNKNWQGIRLKVIEIV